MMLEISSYISVVGSYLDCWHFIEFRHDVRYETRCGEKSDCPLLSLKSSDFFQKLQFSSRICAFIESVYDDKGLSASIYSSMKCI